MVNYQCFDCRPLFWLSELSHGTPTCACPADDRLCEAWFWFSSLHIHIMLGAFSRVRSVIFRLFYSIARACQILLSDVSFVTSSVFIFSRYSRLLVVSVFMLFSLSWNIHSLFHFFALLRSKLIIILHFHFHPHRLVHRHVQFQSVSSISCCAHPSS